MKRFNPNKSTKFEIRKKKAVARRIQQQQKQQTHQQNEAIYKLHGLEFKP